MTAPPAPSPNPGTGNDGYRSEDEDISPDGIDSFMPPDIADPVLTLQRDPSLCGGFRRWNSAKTEKGWVLGFNEAGNIANRPSSYPIRTLSDLGALDPTQAVPQPDLQGDLYQWSKLNNPQDDIKDRFWYNLKGEKKSWDVEENDELWNALQPTLWLVSKVLKSGHPFWKAILSLYHLRPVPKEKDGRTDEEMADPDYRAYISLWYEIDRSQMYPSARQLMDAGFDSEAAALEMLRISCSSKLLVDVLREEPWTPPPNTNFNQDIRNLLQVLYQEAGFRSLNEYVFQDIPQVEEGKSFEQQLWGSEIQPFPDPADGRAAEAFRPVLLSRAWPWAHPKVHLQNRDSVNAGRYGKFTGGGGYRTWLLDPPASAYDIRTPLPVSSLAKFMQQSWWETDFVKFGHQGLKLPLHSTDPDTPFKTAAKASTSVAQFLPMLSMVIRSQLALEFLDYAIKSMYAQNYEAVTNYLFFLTREAASATLLRNRLYYEKRTWPNRLRGINDFNGKSTQSFDTTIFAPWETRLMYMMATNPGALDANLRQQIQAATDVFAELRKETQQTCLNMAVIIGQVDGILGVLGDNYINFPVTTASRRLFPGVPIARSMMEYSKAVEAAAVQEIIALSGNKGIDDIVRQWMRLLSVHLGLSGRIRGIQDQVVVARGKEDLMAIKLILFQAKRDENQPAGAAEAGQVAKDQQLARLRGQIRHTVRNNQVLITYLRQICGEEGDDGEFQTIMNIPYPAPSQQPTA
ncbi:hypothetical protein DHEL01_v206632 [Diaporthe helianthi]|uniref:Uncharacterized protein n=1 Tax=Diaporthe helianthi TaxID=158607 RepID=A0A2P5HXJ1_DIAHE|nr:hypothetical protein DHEL01_v206632 [Diaporthe helianthi]